MFTCLSGAQVMNEKRNAQHRHDRALSAALAKSGPLDFPSEAYERTKFERSKGDLSQFLESCK